MIIIILLKLFVYIVQYLHFSSFNNLNFFYYTFKQFFFNNRYIL